LTSSWSIEADDSAMAEGKKHKGSMDVSYADEGGNVISGPFADLIDKWDQYREEDKKTIADWMDTSLPALDEAMDRAAKGDKDALGGLTLAFTQLPDVVIRELSPELQSKAAEAKADPEAIRAQRRAMRRFEKLSRPEITAEERVMMEIARRQQEQDLRASREAALRDLASRGQLGGGAEVTAMLGAQQETAQRRMLEDLAAQAQAQGRAMEALGKFGDIAGQIRAASFGEEFQRGGASDIMSRFNRQTEEDYNRWRTEQEARNREQRAREYETLYGAGVGTRERDWLRNLQRFGAGATAVGLQTGQGAQYLQGITDITKTQAGLSQAEKAAKALEEEQGLIPNQVPILGWF
jgi:hypothetical protein